MTGVVDGYSVLIVVLLAVAVLLLLVRVLWFTR